uniref:Uncharacterized protein LOC8289796 isoform X1 n=1 Tax=Rhizophora mucronata TaxID=61149 RepID=A0A2P2JAU9_RHIMU
MQDHSSTVSFCPSFSAYSCDKLANIADKVTETEQRNTVPVDVNDDDFEFVPLKASPDAWQSLPLFKVDLLHDHPCRSDRDDCDHEAGPSVEARVRKLFIDDHRDRRSSSSSHLSSDSDELEGAQPGTYCAWRPKSSPTPSPSPGRCQKSSSTGSSRKHRSWRFRDLLWRSRSDGNYTVTCLSENPSNYGNKSHNESKNEVELEKKKAGSKAHKGNKTTQAATTANKVFYGRSKAMKGEAKRKSYLPYRQDLFGFCVYVHGLS